MKDKRRVVAEWSGGGWSLYTDGKGGVPRFGKMREIKKL